MLLDSREESSMPEVVEKDIVKQCKRLAMHIAKLQTVTLFRLTDLPPSGSSLDPASVAV